MTQAESQVSISRNENAPEPSALTICTPASAADYLGVYRADRDASGQSELGADVVLNETKKSIGIMAVNYAIEEKYGNEKVRQIAAKKFGEGVMTTVKHLISTGVLEVNRVQLSQEHQEMVLYKLGADMLDEVLKDAVTTREVIGQVTAGAGTVPTSGEQLTKETLVTSLNLAVSVKELRRRVAETNPTLEDMALLPSYPVPASRHLKNAPQDAAAMQPAPKERELSFAWVQTAWTKTKDFAKKTATDPILVLRELARF